MTPARRAHLLGVARNATAHGRTLTGPHGEALLQAADAIRELAAALEEAEGKTTPLPGPLLVAERVTSAPGAAIRTTEYTLSDEARAGLTVSAPWRWVRYGTTYDLMEGDRVRAFLAIEGDGYRPRIPGHGRCTYADDLPAALAILRAKLGAGVPDLILP